MMRLMATTIWSLAVFVAGVEQAAAHIDGDTGVSLGVIWVVGTAAVAMAWALWRDRAQFDKRLTKLEQRAQNDYILLRYLVENTGNDPDRIIAERRITGGIHPKSP